MKDPKFSRDSQATLERADKIIELIVNDYGYDRESLRGDGVMLSDERMSQCRSLCLYVLTKTVKLSRRKKAAMFGVAPMETSRHTRSIRKEYAALPWFVAKVDRIALLLYRNGLVSDPTVLKIEPVRPL